MLNKKTKIGLSVVLSLIALLAMGLFFSGVTSANEKNATANTEKPVITIAFGEYEDAVPFAVKGKSYKIFEATAKDAYGETLKTTAKAYIYYTSENKSRVNLENGSFVADNYGVYTIEYTAVDKAGATAIAAYDVYCSPKEALSASVKGDMPTVLTAGESLVFPELEFSNANGKTFYEINVKSKTQSRNYTVKSGETFVPFYAGEYVVEYAFGDYCETGTLAFDVKIEKNDNIVFLSDVNVERYYIVGAKYNMPVPEVYTFQSGEPVKIYPRIEVKYGYSQWQTLDGTEFIPKTAGNLEIRYVVAYNGKTESVSRSAKVVDVDYTAETLKMQNYFYSAENTVKKTATSYGVKLATSVKGAVAAFVNKLNAERLTLNLGLGTAGSSLKKFDVSFIDYENSDKSVKITLENIGGTMAEAYVNGKSAGKVPASFTDDEQATEIVYSNADKTVTIGGSSTINIKTFSNGEAFSGFTSDFIYLELIFTDVNGETEISVNKINNQTLFDGADGNEPEIVFTAYDGGIGSIGDTIEVKGISAGDVLDPEYTINYYIKTPSNEFVTDVNGIKLSQENTYYKNTYKFIAKEIGSYMVYMKVSDSFGNSNILSYAIEIADNEKPVITLSDYSDVTAKVGSMVTIRQATATDNMTKEMTVYAYVLNPNGVVKQYSIGEKFKLDAKGKYKVYYYAYDEAGNRAYVKYEIIAE